MDAQRALEARNPLAVFLESLLPWMNFQELGGHALPLQDYADDDDDDGEGDGDFDWESDEDDDDDEPPPRGGRGNNR